MTGCVSTYCMYSEEVALIVGPLPGTDMYENLELEGPPSSNASLRARA